ncbi:hypothetical protein L873DRAFT_1790175 [Choiromyces venosus 120613-1]|uniref:DNA replication checkpoint mediator MRC1 domain-containing protein n=1 Tax=Choiromyces venosus 120613-1 TaxID=1336337 RepID=A0A3N4JK45_9PEZI|nr:hypothetical protein L873DRAFT_1790175 [Choiromyces venosus 120613-1]
MSMTMSSPGTPSRDGSASPVLTPRSKVEAMLAAMESTDEESNGNDDAADEDSEIELDYKPKGKLASRMMPRTSDIKPTKPTKASQTTRTNTTGSGNAYERVKQSLLASKETTSNNLISDVESGDEDKSASTSKAPIETDDDDDDLPVPTPRRKRNQKAPQKASPKAPSLGSTESPKQKGPSRSKSTSPVSASENEEEEEDTIHTLLAANPKKNARFLELVEKKRKGRQAAEAEKQKLEEERRIRRKQLDAQLGCGSADDDDEEDDDDLGVLSQKPPSRKSGKKALEEMHRESQRMARNMHLEHQARTKKKITKHSLFAKFNFRTPAEKLDGNKKGRVPIDSSSIITGSETEPANKSSPKSSPLSETDKKPAKIALGVMDIDDQTLSASKGPAQGESDQMDIDNDSTSAPKLDKGKGKARVTPEGSDKEETAHPALNKGKGKAIEVRPSALDKGKGKAIIISPKKTKPVLPPVRVILPKKLADNASDSDSELEIIKPGDEEKIANSERKKMVDQLRRVKRVKLPVELHGRPKLSARELEAELRKKSRQQAIQEREERIEELRAKGVIILTAEEKARTEQQAVDYMEKARKEALTIKRKEKREENKDGIEKEDATIDDIGVGQDDEEDGDWLEDDDIVEILSGSEEEEAGEDEDAAEKEGGDGTVKPNDFSDEEREHDEDKDENEFMGSPAFSSLYPQDNGLMSPTPRLSEMPAAYIDEEADEDSDESNGDFAPFKALKRKAIRKKKSRIVEEEEDEENDDNAIESDKKKMAESKIPSIFRNKIAQPPPMGMTQLFNGLSGLSSSAGVSVSPEKVKERVEALRQDPGEVIPNSQGPLDFGDDMLDLGFVQEMEDKDSEPIDEPSFPTLDLYYEPSTQMSSFPDPTQDDGFVKSSSPAPPRFDEDEPPSSMQVPDSQPPKRKRGRLMKKGADLTAVTEESEEENGSGGERKSEEVEEKKETAFDIMKKAAKVKAAENFDKSKSGAKEMVHEQAEESEDEYAGIGGASDDEAGDGHDSDVEKMIDDEGKEVVDEDDIAAFWAEKDKAQDEKDVSKLFKDLQTGLFRKKRGADFDLDDSDDDDDGEARRRRAKRRQMAKLRKALMADGNIEKLAANPKKLAFLSAIEDRDRDDEMDFLDKGEEDLFIDLGLLEDSQSRNPSQSHDSREVSAVAEARISREETPGSQHSAGESSKIPTTTSNTRRTTRPKKPSLADVRETLSFLIEENESEMVELSDSDDEPAEVFMHKRRRTTATAVIDRVAASRSNSAASESAKMAFQQSTTETQFRVPSLLRRATTNMSSASGDSQGSSSGTSSSATTSSAGKSMDGGSSSIKRGGKASSSINFHQREQIRAKVENERELKRKQERKKQGQERQSVLGMLTKGSFT